MPIYEYTCDSCGKTVDVIQKVDDPPPEKCEACGKQGSLKRQVSRTSFVLKGGGWYSDLYGSVKKKEGATGSPTATSPSTSSTTPSAPSGGTTSTSAPASTPAPAKPSGPTEKK